MKDPKVDVSMGLGTFLWLAGLVSQTGKWFWLSVILPPFGMYFGTEVILKGLGWL